MTPEPIRNQPDPVHVVPGPEPDRHPHWFQRLSSVLFIVFCFELGLFLLIYPWTEAWTANYFASAAPDRLQPAWHGIWVNPYGRGAVSGLGVVNLWVAMGELFRVFAGKRVGSS
jgi:hypothetical protein